MNVLVDGAGKITFVQLLKLSGVAQLDQQARQLATTRLAFKPATKGGQPVPGTVKVDLNWRLPLSPADDVYSDMMGFSVTGKNVVLPKPIPETHKFLRTDYPTLSIRNGEQGEAVFRIQVLESGNVGDIELLDSSGFSLLDEAARSMVRRFTYQPGMVDGAPAAMRTMSRIFFELTNGTRPKTPPRFCHSHPIIGSSMRMSSDGKEGGGIAVNQWIHIVADERADDVIVETNKGWMHFSPALVRVVTSGVSSQLAASRTAVAPTTGSLIRPTLRPASCWYDANLTVGGK